MDAEQAPLVYREFHDLFVSVSVRLNQDVETQVQ